MRCDDDRPVHHLLRATATTSRDHLTRPPHATTTTFAIVHAHRSDVTSIHPSSAPPSSSSSRSSPSTDRDDPDRAVRPTVRSSRSTDRSSRSFDRSSRSTDRVHRSTDRVHPIPSHPIAQPYPSKYLEPMTVIGWRIHGVRHTSTTGTRPPPTPRDLIPSPSRSRSRVPLPVTTHHESSTETRVCPIPPITTRRDHPRPPRPTARSRGGG